MCMFNKSPSMPAIPPPVAPPPPIDNTKENAESKKARDDNAKRAKLAAGRDSTIATSPLGVVDAPEAKKSTLLGY